MSFRGSAPHCHSEGAKRPKESHAAKDGLCAQRFPRGESAAPVRQKKASAYSQRIDFLKKVRYNKAMKFIELTVHTSTEASELVADAMWNYTPQGVTVCDANDVIALQRESTVFWDYIDEAVSAPQKDVLVKCFLEPDSAEEKIAEIMREIVSRRERSAGAVPFGSLEETKREIEGDDWIDVWKKHFRPIHAGTRIVVVPEWIPYEKQAGEETVLLDSNMAFGTGEHETTSMCLELLQDFLRPGDVCIDLGCGSGILGIAAAKLGAEKCYLTDIDPVAVESAAHNAALNRVQDRLTVALANLLDDSEIKGDLVLANIMAEVLALLAPSIPKNLKAGGTLILSGIIGERLEFVKQTYLQQGLRTVETRRKGEWYALALQREGE